MDSDGTGERPGVLWVTVGETPTEQELRNVRDTLRDHLDDYRVVVTTDGIDTVDAETAERIADRLIDALGGGSDE